MIDPGTVDPMSSTDEELFDGDPIPLTQTVPIPAFPVDMLPGPIAEMVHALAEATQTDPAMAATSALSALAACAGGNAEIEIRSGWREPLCLYTATVAEPGERKSAVQQAMIRPILDVERQMTETMMPARMEAEARRQIAVKAMEQELRTAAKANTDEATANAIGAAAAANIEVPPIPRLVADDVTPEAAASLLAEQKGRLAIISAEGGIFDIIAGRYNGNVPNLDLWLKGHSGDMIRVDRKGRPPEYIPRPALTLGLMIQPEVLAVIAGQRLFRGRGLLARFLYALPVSRVGQRQIGPTPLPGYVQSAYDTHIQGLATGMAGWLGDPAVLMLTPAAHDAVLAIEAAVEPTLADNGELSTLKDWGSKYVGAVTRIAGIIHLAELGAEQGPITPVDAETIHEAWKLGAYFKAAAIGAFLAMGTDHITADAVYLLKRIEKLCGNGDELSERDMHVATQSRFRKKDALMAAVERLVEHGYLVAQQTNRATGGRPASPRYKVRLYVTKGT